MPSRRGIGDYIPAKGEARVLAELKGSYGSKGRSMRTNRSRNRFAAMRKGKAARKPLEFIPLSPGPFASTAVGQKDRVCPIDGHLGTGLYTQWVFALTPEILDYGASDEPGMYLSDDTTEYNRSRMRIVGMRGDLYYTPLAPLGIEQAIPARFDAFSGLMGWSWMRIQAGAIVGGGAGTEPVYPFGDFDSGTVSQNIATGGYTPHIDIIGDADSLPLADKRLRRGRGIINHGTRPWRIDTVWNTALDPESLFPGAGRSIKIPLPRKLVCDVGQGEVLAMVMWQKDFGTDPAISGSPSARLDYPDLRILAYELD